MHEELEALDRAAAAQPEDGTPDVLELLEQALRRMASRAADPDSWLSATRAHDERRTQHLKRLRKGRPMHATVEELLALARADHPDQIEAKRLAIADGFPEPIVPEEGDAADDKDGRQTDAWVMEQQKRIPAKPERFIMKPSAVDAGEKPWYRDAKHHPMAAP